MSINHIGKRKHVFLGKHGVDRPSIFHGFQALWFFPIIKITFYKQSFKAEQKLTVLCFV